MVSENGTQRGSNAAAALDSVAGITERLAYVLFRWSEFDHVSKFLETCPFKNEKSFDTARGLLLKGKAIGEPKSGVI